MAPPSHIRNSKCNIVPVGKRRDGGTRYWCLEHKADATAKYGKRGRACRYANVPPIHPQDRVRLELESYSGGVALWGAVPPVYDTTELPLDRGIHVHARKQPEGPKVIDRTYRHVDVLFNNETHPVSELDAIYFMVSVSFGQAVKLIHCSRCGHPHLDKDWFSVHPHQAHLCAGCGRTFRDNEISVGNPIAKLHEFPTLRPPSSRSSRKDISIKQSDYPGGIRLWGSNQAIVWTGRNPPDAGIHLHAFKEAGAPPAIDDTYRKVRIDGVPIHTEQVQLRMAQSALPHISDRVRSIPCGQCGTELFDKGSDAFTPRSDRRCPRCGQHVAPKSRLRKLVANPLDATLQHLAANGPREPQRHDLELLPETL